jgi:hypothetical protein
MNENKTERQRPAIKLKSVALEADKKQKAVETKKKAGEAKRMLVDKYHNTTSS